MFSSTCCTCDYVDRGEEDFGQRSRGNKVIYDSAVGMDNASQPLTQNRSPEPTERSAFSERGPERAKLQELVKDFSKLALRGVSCSAICGQTGQLYSATYSVSSTLDRLSVKPSNAEDPTRPVEIPMTSIRDFHEHEAGRSVAAEGVIWAQKAGKKEQLIVVETFDQHKYPPVFLVEASPQERDRFIMCMKVLRLYARADANDSLRR